MDLITAIVLGVVQGIVEFLPVSSSGHLVVLERLLGFGMPQVAFHAFLHAGSAIAVIYILRRDVLHLVVEAGRMAGDLLRNFGEFLRSLLRGEEPNYVKLVRTNYRKLVVLFFASSVPTAILGFCLERAARALSSSLMYTGIGFLLTGVTLLVTSNLQPKNELPRDIPVWKMVLVGAAQGMAVLPGISRFALTMSGCILAGMSRNSAIRISMLMLLPFSAGALAAELFLPGMQGIGSPGNLPLFVLPAAVAAVTGILFMRPMLRFVQVRKLSGFARYCMAAGLVTAACGLLVRI